MPNATLAQMGFVDENEQEVVYDLEDTQSRTDISTINGKIPSAASSTNKLVDTTAMNDAIGQAVSAVYKPGGNKTVAELTSSLLIADNRGKVYNMTDAGTTTADFIEGAGKPIKIGDEVGICEPTTGTFKFNMLSGIIPVDTNPTSGSANAVSSGGVYSALDGKISKSSSAGYVKNDGTIDTELATTVANKVDKVAGKGLSTNDYNNTAKGIVDNIQDNVKANTQLIKDTVGWSGKNKFNPSAISLNGQYATLNSDGSSIEVKVTTAETYRSTSWIMPVERNTNYIISSIVDFVSGGGYVLVKTPDDSANIWASAQFTSDGEINASFNSGANDSVLIKMFCTLATSEVGDVIYKNFMIRKATILDSTYEHYHKNVVNTLREAEVIQGKNIFNNKTNTVGGITFTVDNDGYTTESNANDERSSLDYSNYNIFMNLKAGRYFMRIFQKTAKTTGYIGLHIADSSLNKYVAIGDETDWNNAINNGLYFTIPSDMEVGILYKVGNGSYAFMITDDSETDHDYEPYYIPLKDSIFPRSEQAVLGAKNLLSNIGTSGSDKNATWTVNADGTITVTTGEDSTSGEVNITIGNCNVKQGVRYTISDDSPNPSGSTYRLWTNSTTAFGTNNRLSTGTEAARTRTANADETVSVVLQIFSGQKVNLTFKPMIRLASDPDDTYVPYAMTNRGLTEKVTLKKIAESAGNQTWGEQLTALNTTYSTLNGAEKLNTFIAVNDNANDGLYRLFVPSVGVFGNISMFTDGTTVINTLRLGNQNASSKTINTSGSVTVTNLTNETNSNKLILYSKG